MLVAAAAPRAPAAELRIESAGVSLVNEATVAAQEAGTLADLPVREGQIVKQGELLAQLDFTHAEAELKQAQIQRHMAALRSASDVKVRLAKTTLKLAETDLRRAEESNKRFTNSVSEEKLDRFRLAVAHAQLDVEQADEDLANARLALEAAENAVRLAEVELERRRIIAPIDGQVVELRRRKGEWVQPGDPVVRVVQVELLRVEAFVPVGQLTSDLSGCPAVLTVDLPGRGETAFAGTVTFVNPEVNPVSGQVAVWAEIANPERLLRPGSLGTLVIHPE